VLRGGQGVTYTALLQITFPQPFNNTYVNSENHWKELCTEDKTAQLNVKYSD